MSQRNIYRKGLLTGIFCFIFLGLHAQNYILDTYTLLQNGDTINKVDTDGKRWGKWFEEYNSDKKYFYTVGEYIDGLKQGVWQVYNTNDEMIEKSNYRNGARHGRSTFFANGQISSTGDYIGFYSSLKDTFMVEDPYVDTLIEFITDLHTYSYKNGPWYYLNEYTGDTLRIEHFYFGEVLSSEDFDPAMDSVVVESIKKKLPHNKDRPLQLDKKPNKPYFPKQ